MPGDAAALGRAFVTAWSGASDRCDPGRLGELLRTQLAHGRARWPAVEVDSVVYAAFVAERVSGDGEPEAALAELRAEDLFLVCACLQRSEPAAVEFRAYVAGAVRSAVGRIAREAAEDVMHRLYDRLFLAEPGGVPKIQGYRGRGDVRRWVSVVATRIAIDGRRHDQSDVRLRTLAVQRLVEHMQTMELEYLRGFYREEFKEACGAAVESLDDHERNVLRYQLEGLSADQVGRLYNVHRVTVARWLSRIRSTLLERTRERLRQRLGVNAEEADSILRLIDGEASVSIMRLLASPEQP